MYGRSVGFDDEAMDDLHYYIKEMDHAFLKREEEKKPKPKTK